MSNCVESVLLTPISMLSKSMNTASFSFVLVSGKPLRSFTKSRGAPPPREEPASGRLPLSAALYSAMTAVGHHAWPVSRLAATGRRPVWRLGVGPQAQPIMTAAEGAAVGPTPDYLPN